MCSLTATARARTRAKVPLFIRGIAYLTFLFLVVPIRPALADAAYRFGPGDVLAISVFGQQKLSGKFKVSSDGTINFPVIGEVVAVKLTRAELEHEIGRLLTEQMPGAGRVGVEVAEYAPVFVIGDVEKPGSYEYRPGMVVLELLALAGGSKRLLLDQSDPALRLIALEQELADLRLQRYGQAVTRARLLAEIAGRDFAESIDANEDQPIMLAQKEKILHDEHQLFEVRASVLANREKTLKQQHDSYNQEITALSQSIALQQEELNIIGQEVDTAGGLVTRGLATESKLLDLKREQSVSKRNALELQSFLARAQQRQLAVTLEIEELHNTRADELAKSLRDLDLEIARTDEKLSATTSRLAALGSTGTGGDSSGATAPLVFQVMRLTEGEYRAVQVAERDPLQPHDILQVSRQTASPKITAPVPLQSSAPNVPAVAATRSGGGS